MGKPRAACVLAMLCFGLTVHAPARAAETETTPLPLTDFARDAEYESADISPDGRYLALKQPHEDQTILVIVDLKERKVSGVLRLGKDQHVFKHWWVGPERIVASVAEQFGSLEQPALTGELIGMDADGTRRQYLFGARGLDQTGQRMGGGTAAYAWADMIDPTPADPDTALISTRSMYANASEYGRAEKLRVVGGKLRLAANAPKPGAARFLADPDGEVRYVSVRGIDSKTQTFWRGRRTDDWKPLEAKGMDSFDVVPLAFSTDGETVYFQSHKAGNRSCLVAQPLAEAKAPVELACDEHADLDEVIWLDGKTPIGAMFQAGYPRLQALPAGDAAGWKTYLGLVNAFDGRAVLPVSRTLDGKQLVLQVFSDRDPGSFYLYDREHGQLEELFAQRKWIDPQRMAERRPFSVRSKDGRTVWGYLTLPPGVPAKGLPLIVHPHGGPCGIRDEWRWDADPQMLASRGYAVLQVNFRGSGGYGREHHEAGRYQWGGAMIDDLLAATEWAIEQGHADPQRICSYGASYGAYAALMLAIRAPERFRCVIGYAGAYDLELLARDSDIPESRFGRAYIKQFIGKDDAALAAQSPVRMIDTLKAPVLIAHGKEDFRTPLSQAEALRDALDAKQLPYEWLVKPREGHGFYIKENRVELYERMLAFLDRHIGEGRVAATPLPNPLPQGEREPVSPAPFAAEGLVLPGEAAPPVIP